MVTCGERKVGRGKMEGIKKYKLICITRMYCTAQGV